jgi:hypothetical protein
MQERHIETCTLCAEATMSSVSQQLPALLGVVVGSIATYLSSTFAERIRWRRETSSRWESRRITAISDYAAAVKKLIYCAGRAAAARGIGSAQPIELDQGLAELAEAETARSVCWEKVLLLGDHATILAARTWHELVWQLYYFAIGERTDHAEWEKELEAVNQARDEYYRCARTSLGIDASPPPAAAWPRDAFFPRPSEPVL